MTKGERLIGEMNAQADRNSFYPPSASKDSVLRGLKLAEEILFGANVHIEYSNGLPSKFSFDNAQYEIMGDSRSERFRKLGRKGMALSHEKIELLRRELTNLETVHRCFQQIATISAEVIDE
jgi:hypothetical protein